MAPHPRERGVPDRPLARLPRPRWTASPARSPAAARSGAHSIGAVDVLAQLGPEEGGGGAQAAQVAPTQTPTTAPTLSPYRVFFSIAQVANPGCQVPAGSNGAAKVAKYRVVGPGGAAGRVTVGEQFTALEDPYSVFSALHPNSYTTDASGRFDDCYLVATRQSLPDDFRLKVEQNHLIGGQIASKQHITFTPGNVFICVFDRRGNAFASRCRRY